VNQPVTSLDGPRVSRGPRVAAAPKVSIIVLITTSIERVERCLASIAAAGTADAAFEVIVLANGTPPGTLERLASRDDIVLVRSAVNHGFGGGCNWAVRFARGARLLFLNDDAAVTPGWLTALNVAMDVDPRVGVAGSRVLLRDGRLQEAGNVIWSDGSTSHIGRGLPPGDPALVHRRDVDYVSFCSAMVRRATWDDVGGFDERYFPAYYEDADLCLSARAKGWRVVCEPASVVVHDEGSSTDVRFRHFVSRRNQRLFAAKWRAALASCDDRPRRVVPRVLVEKVARRTPTAGYAGPVVAETTSTRKRRQGAGARRARGPVEAAVDEMEALRVELQHLAADAALKEEYITFLASRLDHYGAADLTQRRYRAVRGELGRLLRRSPQVAGAVEALKARIGERTSQ
jgi:GT2 family glycosyltransferase